MRESLLLFFLGIWIYLPSLAQSDTVDSLQIAYKSASSDSARIKILKDISWEYLNNRSNSELAKVFIDSVYNLSSRSNIEWGKSLANYQYAVLERQLGNYNEALDYLEKYLSYTESLKDSNALANGLYQKAIILDDIGSTEKSLAIYYEILKIYEDQNDPYSIAFTLNALGEILKKTGKPEAAMEQYTRALSIFTELDNKVDMANCYFNIGDTYFNLQETDSALVYFNQALKLDHEIQSDWGMAFDYEAIGKIYSSLENYDAALEQHKLALELRKDLGLKRELSLSHSEMGLIYLKTKNYPDAETHLLTALDISEEIGAKAQMQTNYEALSRFYEKTGNLTLAIAYKDRYIAIKEELYNESKSQQIEELQVRFDTEKQQAAISSLEKDAEIADLKIKRQTTFRNITIGITLMTILLSFALFNRYKYRQRVKTDAKEKIRILENERRKTEIEKKRVAELKKIDRLKDEFLANTSHELRTPLNGIIGLTESLKDGVGGKLTDKALDNLEMISSSGKRLAQLINDILDFSKLKNQDLNLALKPVDLHAVTDVVIKLLVPLARDKGLSLINNIREDTPLVEADENRVQQILHNLIGNAIKFTESGEIEISAKSEEKFLKSTVSDTGIGIPESMYSSIFDSFEQGDGSVERKHGGTGLGLSVTKQLVELHKGSIHVASREGIGTQFTFSLPLSTAQRSDPDIANKPDEDRISSIEDTPEERDQVEEISADRKGFRILIVDDEPVNRRVLHNHLTVAGYLVTEVHNGQEALRLLEEGNTFDAVLLDVMMPGMSGYEVCEKIRERYLTSELPIVLLTAKNRVSDLVAGFNVGANDYLTKPFSKNELLSRIKTHLNLNGIHKATSRFVPSEFLESVGREEITEVKLGDHVEKKVTVLFSDIRDYTSLAESMTPRQNFKFVNAYVGKMGPIIKSRHGFVNQYLGDGIMALFTSDPQDALEAAIEMQHEVQRYNDRRIRDGYVPISIGIGFHTGPLVMGIIGDIYRNDTAIVADTVNTASRMEGLTKHYGAKIIISENSLKTIKNKEDFGLRYLGKVKVKGKDNAIGVYECFDGDKDQNIIALKRKTLKHFQKGINHYLNHEFPKASASFNKVLSLNPNDKVAKYFLAQAAEKMLKGDDDADVVTKMDLK